MKKLFLKAFTVNWLSWKWEWYYYAKVQGSNKISPLMFSLSQAGVNKGILQSLLLDIQQRTDEFDSLYVD
jgi:hypothetical protein